MLSKFILQQVRNAHVYNDAQQVLREGREQAARAARDAAIEASRNPYEGMLAQLRDMTHEQLAQVMEWTVDRDGNRAKPIMGAGLSKQAHGHVREVYLHVRLEFQRRAPDIMPFEDDCTTMAHIRRVLGTPERVTPSPRHVDTSTTHMGRVQRVFHQPATTQVPCDWEHAKACAAWQAYHRGEAHDENKAHTQARTRARYLQRRAGRAKHIRRQLALTKAVTKAAALAAAST